MNAINRHRLLTLYGQLMLGTRQLSEIDAELREIIADEKTHSYHRGIMDVKEGKWGK